MLSLRESLMQHPTNLNYGYLALIRGADTDRHDLTPESGGLFAISLGLSYLHPEGSFVWREDTAQDTIPGKHHSANLHLRTQML
jgi:hypothetical protein